MRGIFFSALFQLIAVATAQSSASTVDVIPGVVVPGASDALFTHAGHGFDGPKVKPINGTDFDWWYFDVVSDDLDYSLVLAFFASTPEGLWPGFAPSLGEVTWAVALVTLPDGTVVKTPALGTGLVVNTTGDGSSGVLGGTGWSWSGSPDMSSYTVTLVGPELPPDVGVVAGTVKLQSTSPAHLPCKPLTAAGAGDSLSLATEFGWANAVPDANAQVDLIVNGKEVKFSGVGYHDKNWGSGPVSEVIKSWYWGHGRVGPFSIVWFWVMAADGSEKISSYVTRNGKVLASSCDGIIMRPTGVNSVFPPVAGNDAPGGYHMSMNVDGEGTLEVDVTHKAVIFEQPGAVYRWIGTVSGGFGNGTTWSGSALYEQFTL